MSVVVSGSGWMGNGFVSIETALINLFQEAENEVLIVAYTISGGATTLFQQLESVLQRGVKLRMIINRFDRQSEDVRANLLALNLAYPTLMDVYSFIPDSEYADLHAKIIVIDRKRALVGSANLSLRGLLRNHELAVVVDGKAVYEIARAIDILGNSPYSHLLQG